jgi:ribose transport system ATP-binding protein
VKPALELSGVSKRYGATSALTDVAFEVAEGSTHAIIGENGAGKSTLIRALSGLETLDAGSMRLGGADYRPGNLGEARRRGVSTAFQDLSLLPNLTVAENLFLPRLGRGPFVRRKANESSAHELLGQYGLSHIRPTRQVATLPLADKQKLEIVRAVSHQPKLLLLDEPSAALPDVEWLYRLLEQVRRPDLTVLYISHRLTEIRDLCQAATVLRNGRVVDTVRIKDVDDGVVFSMMGGASEGHGAQRRGSRSATGRPAIAVRNLHGRTVADVTFTLHRGEILGVAALDGQGQAETFRILAGVARASSGAVEVDGRPARITSPGAALRRGVSFVAEERKTEGILPGLSTMANMTIGALDKAGTAGLLRRRRERGSALGPSDQVDLSHRYLTMDIDALSGGNQQKAILARSLMQGSKYLLLYDPSRGVDVGTKGTIYSLMERLVSDGEGAVLWYSTDLAELTGVCDRILCFYKGKVIAEVPGEGATVEALLTAITGHVDAPAEVTV